MSYYKFKLIRWEGNGWNVQIWNSVDGKSYSYCGNGRFCSSMAEADSFMRAYRNSSSGTYAGTMGLSRIE